MSCKRYPASADAHILGSLSGIVATEYSKESYIAIGHGRFIETRELLPYSRLPLIRKHAGPLLEKRRTSIIVYSIENDTYGYSVNLCISIGIRYCWMEHRTDTYEMEHRIDRATDIPHSFLKKYAEDPGESRDFGIFVAKNPPVRISDTAMKLRYSNKCVV